MLLIALNVLAILLVVTNDYFSGKKYGLLFGFGMFFGGLMFGDEIAKKFMPKHSRIAAFLGILIAVTIFVLLVYVYTYIMI